MQTFIAPDAAPERLDRRNFDLEKLRDGALFELVPEDPIERFQAVSMLVSPCFCEGGLVTISRKPLDGAPDVFESSRDWFGDQDKLLDRAWRIESVKIRFYFPKEEGFRRARADRRSDRAEPVQSP